MRVGRALLALALLAGCRASAPPLPGPAYFAARETRRAFVMGFNGHPGLKAEMTEVFVAELSSRTAVTLLRPDPDPFCPPKMLTFLGMPMFPLEVPRAADCSEQPLGRFLLVNSPLAPLALLTHPQAKQPTPIARAMREARRKAADILIDGTVTSVDGSGHNSAQAHLWIYDVSSGRPVASVDQRRQTFLLFSAQPAMKAAVIAAAAETRELLGR